jgi:hypothetical protein
MIVSVIVIEQWNWHCGFRTHAAKVEGKFNLDFDLARSAGFVTHRAVRPSLNKVTLTRALTRQLEVVRKGDFVVDSQLAADVA